MGDQVPCPERRCAWSEEIEWQTVQQKTIYNRSDGAIQFSKLRVMDLPTCRRITVPEPRENDDEIVFASMKNKIDAVTDNSKTIVMTSEI